jgi:hypothetical protein
MAGPGFGAIAGVDNYNVKAGNGLGPRTRIISLSNTDMTQAELDAMIGLLTVGGTSGTDDAVSVAGITAFEAGVTDVVHVAVQGTGVLTAGADYRGQTGTTMAVVADFAD